MPTHSPVQSHPSLAFSLPQVPVAAASTLNSSWSAGYASGTPMLFNAASGLRHSRLRSCKNGKRRPHRFMIAQPVALLFALVSRISYHKLAVISNMPNTNKFRRTPQQAVCTETVSHVCTETVSHVCTETVSHMCTETVSHMCTETVSHMCTETVSHVCTETVSHVCTETVSHMCTETVKLQACDMSTYSSCYTNIQNASRECNTRTNINVNVYIYMYR